MSEIDKKLAVIVPTRDRPEDLTNLFENIAGQSLLPGQIIIVDSGDMSLERVISGFQHLRISYIRCKPPSLTAQRNLGLRHLNEDARIVAFFDDDVIFQPNALNHVMEYFESSDSRVAGVGCNNISDSRNKISFLEKLFLVGSNKIGVVLPSGFQSRVCSVDNNYQVQWIMGGATFWRRAIFDAYKFDEWFSGYAHCEDIDFSYRISKKYKLFILNDAKFTHNTKPIEVKYEYHLGIMQVVNRLYFVSKNQELSLILCYWACAGLFLKNIFLGTMGYKPRYLLRALGLIRGVVTIFFKKKRISARIKK